MSNFIPLYCILGLDGWAVFLLLSILSHIFVASYTIDNDGVLSLTIGVNYVNAANAETNGDFHFTFIQPAVEKARMQAEKMFENKMKIKLVEKFHAACPNSVYYDFHEAVLNAEAMLTDPNKVDVMIGSPCTEEFLLQAAMCAYQGPDRLTPQTPILTGAAIRALHVNQFTNAYRVSYSSATEYDMIFRMCKLYNWTHITIINEDTPDKKVIAKDFATVGRVKYSLIINSFGFSASSSLDEVLDNIRNNSRVGVFLASGTITRQLILMANALGMCDGSYAFFTSDLFHNEILNPTGTLIDSAIAFDLIAAFGALQVMTLSRYSSQTNLTPFDKSTYGVTQKKNLNYYTISHYNALLVAALMIDRIARDPTAKVDTFKDDYIKNSKINFSFLGLSNSLFLTDEGDLSEGMDMWDFDPVTKTFQPICNYQWIRSPNGNFSQSVTCIRNVLWGPTSKVPDDMPYCGYKNDAEHCKNQDYTVIIVSTVSGAVAFIIIVILSVKAWLTASRERESSLSWLLHWEDIVVPTTDNSDEQKIREEVMRVGDEDRERIESFNLKSVEAEDGEMYKKILPYGVYWNQKLYMARLSPKYRLHISKKIFMEINRVSQMKHENLAVFEGACLDADHVLVLYEYCAKGTLQTMLLDIQLKLDWIIRFSLINDIVKGLFYIHQSHLIFLHGRLTSCCCYVDARFVLKIGDYGLNSFFELSVAEQWATKRGVNYFSNMLWTAPEQIRIDLMYGIDTLKPPSKAGDIYSFAIILQEIFLRIRPFGMYGAMNAEATDTDLVHEIRKPISGKDDSEIPLRPTIPDESADRGLIELAIKCWAQNPTERPSIKQIKVMIKNLGKSLGFGEKGSILNTLLDQMDELMSNLQNIIEERGHILLEEKTRSENLLFRLLPRGIAERMKKGEIIHPESFESCSVLLFCIYNFDKIIADCTVLQITEFVLDFHAFLEDCMMRYDCIKVDYHDSMGTLASGIPVENEGTHASQLAKLALHLMFTVRLFETRHAMVEEGIKLGIGIHSGPCVAGVVGEILPRYSIFGETVQIALRMLETADEHNAQCSIATKELLSSDFQVVEHGEVFVKGKGTIVCYSIRGVRGDPELAELHEQYVACGGRIKRRKLSYTFA